MTARATICTWLLANQNADAFTASEEIIKALEADGFVIAPKEPTAMMALRGGQAQDVFAEGDLLDDYLALDEIPQEFAPQHKLDDDERSWIVAAAAYRGAIKGLIECRQRLEKDPCDGVALSWSEPFRRIVPQRT